MGSMIVCSMVIIGDGWGILWWVGRFDDLYVCLFVPLVIIGTGDFVVVGSVGLD